ncbi:MAG: putative DNA replication licensing factor Mcm4 [Streblomastix strix]|uniref:DNA helicase n=1 Tax=Streblomastix strix TaxID=222440 RepID=A0A5J4V807_9EUKA|nr:MAG: putative DNA replication licensing factor Mcm4 [Streblomastix strix]
MEERVKKMREVGFEDAGKLVSIDGFVTHVSSIVPVLETVTLRCVGCNTTAEVPAVDGKVVEPRSCGRQGCQTNWTIIHNKSKFIGKQIIQLQEEPGEIPEGTTPVTVTIVATDELINKCTPGDRITVKGMCRLEPSRASGRGQSMSAVFSTFIEAIRMEAHRQWNGQGAGQAGNWGERILASEKSNIGGQSEV